MYTYHLSRCRGGLLIVFFFLSLCLQNCISISPAYDAATKYNENEQKALATLDFYAAIKTGDLALVESLVDSGCNLNMVDQNGYSLLHWTVYDSRLEIPTLLLQRGANVNITDQAGFTPLHRAITHGNEAIVKLFLEKGANPNITTINGYTPFHLATLHNHLEIVNLLLDKGADPTIVDQDGFTPLYCAIDRGYVKLVKVFLDKGVDPNMPISDGSTPLHWAAYDGNLAIVNLLLERGADPSLADTQNCTPLHLAAYKGHMPVILRLLLCNLDINAQDDHGDTFLYSLLDNDSIRPEEGLHKFLEAIQGIEKKQASCLNTLTEVMQDYCLDLTNGDTKIILAMMVDYIQGVDLRLKNQDETSVADIVQIALTEIGHCQSKNLLKTLDRHQTLGGWLIAHTQRKRKANSHALSSQHITQASALKKAKTSCDG